MRAKVIIVAIISIWAFLLCNQVIQDHRELKRLTEWQQKADKALVLLVQEAIARNLVPIEPTR